MGDGRPRAPPGPVLSSETSVIRAPDHGTTPAPGEWLASRAEKRRSCRLPVPEAVLRPRVCVICSRERLVGLVAGRVV